MIPNHREFALETLAKAFGIPRRRIRWYIDGGLVDPPIDRTRGAYYTDCHIRQLQRVLRLKQAGYKHEHIVAGQGVDPPQNPSPAPGTVVRWHRWRLHDGLEVHARADQAAAEPEALAALQQAIQTGYQAIRARRAEAAGATAASGPEPEPTGAVGGPRGTPETAPAAAESPEALASSPPGASPNQGGSVIVFSGHLIDAPDRREPRFPAWLEPRVKQALWDHLVERNPVVGVGAAACGSDILFLEAVRRLGGSIQVVLPFDITDFMRTSVLVDRQGRWAERYYSILEQADSIILAQPRPTGQDGADFDLGNQKADRVAQEMAQARGLGLESLAVWDGQPAAGPGGTASCVERWRAQGPEPTIIDLAALRATAAPDP